MSLPSEIPSRRHLLFAACVGAGVGLATAAIAAAITLTTTSSLAAGSAVLNAPCDSAYQIDLTDPVWDAGTGAYVVTGFTVSGVDAAACSTSLIGANALDSNGASLADATTVAADGLYSWSTSVPVASVASIASVIYEQ